MFSQDKSKIFMAKYFCVRLHALFGTALAFGMVLARVVNTTFTSRPILSWRLGWEKIKLHELSGVLKRVKDASLCGATASSIMIQVLNIYLGEDSEGIFILFPFIWQKRFKKLYDFHTALSCVICGMLTASIGTGQEMVPLGWIIAGQHFLLWTFVWYHSTC